MKLCKSFFAFHVVLSLLLAVGAFTPVFSRPLLPPAVLRGHFEHAPMGDTVRLAYLNHLGRKRAKVPLSPNGDFVLAVKDIVAGTPAVLEYGGQHTSLYLTPSGQLSMTLDYLRFDQTLQYTGDGATMNNYLARSLWQFEYSPAGPVPRPRDDKTIAFSPTQMRRCADAFRWKRLAFLNAWARSHHMPLVFCTDAATHINLQWLLALLEYPALHNRLTNSNKIIPASYYTFLTQVPPHTLDPFPRRDLGSDDNGLVMSCLLAYRFRLMPSGKLSTDPADAKRIYLQAITELGRVAADEAMLLFIDSQLQVDGNWVGVLAAYPIYRELNRDSARARFMHREISKRQLLQPDEVAPDFTLVDRTGQMISLKSFRGKVIYLDFWGTWCKPCLAEMPASLALRQRFTGKDVVFIYIDVSDTETAWQKALATTDLTGANSIHLRSPNKAVPAAYQVVAYPRYVLIRRDGLIEMPIAPRPSDEAETNAAIEATLKKIP